MITIIRNILILFVRPNAKVVVMAVCFEMRKMTFVYPSLGHHIDNYPTNMNNKAIDVGFCIIMLDRQNEKAKIFVQYPSMKGLPLTFLKIEIKSLIT